MGSKTLGIASFFLRAVCMNRNIADSSPAAFISGVRTAREQMVARKDEDRETFLRKRGFSKPETERIIATVLSEEGRPPHRGTVQPSAVSQAVLGYESQPAITLRSTSWPFLDL